MYLKRKGKRHLLSSAATAAAAAISGGGGKRDTRRQRVRGGQRVGNRQRVRGVREVRASPRDAACLCARHWPLVRQRRGAIGSPERVTRRRRLGQCPPVERVERRGCALVDQQRMLQLPTSVARCSHDLIRDDDGWHLLGGRDEERQEVDSHSWPPSLERGGEGLRARRAGGRATQLTSQSSCDRLWHFIAQQQIAPITFLVDCATRKCYELRVCFFRVRVGEVFTRCLTPGALLRRVGDAAFTARRDVWRGGV
mmetsp:Transcript_23230/g.58968  ORF Transcript_23230/g.58968 Transcript_23230/m.58968 type:complete len:254 (+) Transcript_23230:1584-2345(+)